MTAPKKNKGRNKGWDNLKPAKKGEVRNKTGRPKKEVCIPDILRKLAHEKSEYDPKNLQTKLERVCDMAFRLAQGGDKDARNWIANRMEGMPQQSISMKSDIQLSIQERLKQISNMGIDEVIAEINKSVIAD